MPGISKKEAKDLGYTPLTTVSSEAEVKRLCTHHYVNRYRCSADGLRTVYRCTRRCGFDLMVEKDDKGSEILFRVFTRGAHSHELVKKRSGRPSDWFEICNLESVEDVRATVRGYRRLKPNSGSAIGYYRCKNDGCPNEI